MARCSLALVVLLCFTCGTIASAEVVAQCDAAHRECTEDRECRQDPGCSEWQCFMGTDHRGTCAAIAVDVNTNTVVLPSKMRAAVVSSRSWDFKFHLDKVDVIDLDLPSLASGQVLVEVHAANVNPVDHKIVELAGLLWSYPHKLGSDLAGVVVAVGPECERLKVGDQVWGEATALSTQSLEAVSTGGTYAQYAAVDESVLGIRPQSLSWLEAGAMPMVALTGYDSLMWAAGAPKFNQSNVTVLVLGGSGGTGHLGIQLAKNMGAARVITTCSGAHADFVRSLGADEVIDYHEHNYSDVLPPRSVDVVYDCVGQKGTGDLSYPLLKENGHFVTLLSDGTASMMSKIARPDVHSYTTLCVGGCSQYTRIDAIAEMVNAGKLKVHIDKTYSLDDIRQAYNYSIAGRTTGKVAVEIKSNASRVAPALMI